MVVRGGLFMAGGISSIGEKNLSTLLLRFLQCNRSDIIYANDEVEFIKDKYLKTRVKNLSKAQPANAVVYLNKMVGDKTELNHIIELLKENNIILTIDNSVEASGYCLSELDKDIKVNFYGPCFSFCYRKVPDEFKVLAIIHVYNEEDVIEQTTMYLLSQGIDVYLIDNWSTDGTYEIIKKLVNNFPQRVFGRRYPENERKDYYDWYNQLMLSENISKKLNYNWYIHYDADEYRVAPWKGVTLKEAIYYIDSLGYNLIENTVIDFKVTKRDDSSIFMKDTWFDFGHRKAHFEQTKTWKKCENIDLKQSGGHLAKIDDPKVFPLKILNRHYPLRSYEHANKKIFNDRKPRYMVENKTRGWHGHYNNILNGNDIIVPQQGLIKWTEKTFDELYIQLFTGCGIEVETENLRDSIYKLQEKIDKGCLVSIYGAGKIGKLIYDELSSEYTIEHWVDKNYKRIQPMFGRCIESPSEIINSESRVIIAIEDESIAKSVEENLINMGVDYRRMLWEKW